MNFFFFLIPLTGVRCYRVQWENRTNQERISNVSTMKIVFARQKNKWCLEGNKNCKLPKMMGRVILLVARRARESSCKKIREKKEQERGKALAKVDARVKKEQE
jgi:hypothetical protein